MFWINIEHISSIINNVVAISKQFWMVLKLWKIRFLLGYIRRYVRSVKNIKLWFIYLMLCCNISSALRIIRNAIFSASYKFQWFCQFEFTCISAFKQCYLFFYKQWFIKIFWYSVINIFHTCCLAWKSKSQARFDRSKDCSRATNPANCQRSARDFPINKNHKLFYWSFFCRILFFLKTSLDTYLIDTS